MKLTRNFSFSIETTRLARMVVSALLCLCMLISTLGSLSSCTRGESQTQDANAGTDTGADGNLDSDLDSEKDKQVPVYRGMTVSNDAPVAKQVVASVDYPMFSMLAATASDMPAYDISLLGEDDDSADNAPNDDDSADAAPEGDDSADSAPEEEENDAPEIVFGETYYAMKNEDIYIHVHISNPAEYEILSFTLNGKKYSSNMFEYGSDLQTLILKYNVGDVDGLQEYTIDAIKYIDGDRIKDARMEGDQTVKVYVNDEKDLLQFHAELSFTTLTIAPSKPLLSLELYEGETKLRNLSPSTTEITDLPFDKRLMLKATYHDGNQTRTAQYLFDSQKLSTGLIIADGVIYGLGACTDTVLYINLPVADNAFQELHSIVEVYMGPGVTFIGEFAFAGCKRLSYVEFPNTLTRIGDSAFVDNLRLESVNIPGSVKNIGIAAFAFCESLKSVIIQDGVLSIGQHAFMENPALIEISLPASIISMGVATFAKCSKLTKVYLADGLTVLGKTTFGDCNSLNSLHLPSSITTMERNLFRNATSLTELYFDGTMDQWKRINKDKEWNRESSLVVVRCVDGDVDPKDEEANGIK